MEETQPHASRTAAAPQPQRRRHSGTLKRRAARGHTHLKIWRQHKLADAAQHRREGCLGHGLKEPFGVDGGELVHKDILTWDQRQQGRDEGRRCDEHLCKQHASRTAAAPKQQRPHMRLERSVQIAATRAGILLSSLGSTNITGHAVSVAINNSSSLV